MVAGNIIHVVLKKMILLVCEFKQLRLEGMGELPQILLFQKLLKHAVGYMGEISQVKTHSKTHREVSGECQGVRERGNWWKDLSPHVKINKRFLLLCLLPFSNRRHVEVRISRQLLTSSAWLPTDWNTIKAKSHSEWERNRNTPIHTVMGVHMHNMTNRATTGHTQYVYRLSSVSVPLSVWIVMIQ